MKEEDKVINDYLNPLLGKLMQQSLDSIMEMKQNKLLENDEDETKNTIKFIKEFIEDSEIFYSNIKDMRNLAILSDLKQYILKIDK